MDRKEPGEEMKEKLLNNWALKLASLVLAVVLWFLVVIINDPQDTTTFSNIAVKLTNTELLAQENKVYEVLDNTDTVSVKVRAPKSVIDQLRASDIVAEADVRKLTDINTIAIDYSVNIAGVESIDGNHDVVRLTVEDKVTRWIKVVYNTVGEVAKDYMIAGVTPDQNIIEISGPRSAVESVEYAGVEIDVSEATYNRSANVDITLYDENNSIVRQDNIAKNVDYIHMSVEVLATKEVPVEINYMGMPADGYMATGTVLSDPDTVKIAGTAYALSRINKITIPEERLNITGESSDMTDIINIADYLPDNIRLADSDFNGKVTATIAIEPIAERTLEIPLENVEVINMPAGLRYALADEVEYYTLHISGLAERVEAVHPDQLRGVIDIAAWMEEQEIAELTSGGYTVPVTFVLSEGVTAEEISVWMSVKEEG